MKHYNPYDEKPSFLRKFLYETALLFYVSLAIALGFLALSHFLQ